MVAEGVVRVARVGVVGQVPVENPLVAGARGLTGRRTHVPRLAQIVVRARQGAPTVLTILGTGGSLRGALPAELGGTLALETGAVRVGTGGRDAATRGRVALQSHRVVRKVEAIVETGLPATLEAGGVVASIQRIVGDQVAATVDHNIIRVVAAALLALGLAADGLGVGVAKGSLEVAGRGGALHGALVPVVALISQPVPIVDVRTGTDASRGLFGEDRVGPRLAGAAVVDDVVVDVVQHPLEVEAVGHHRHPRVVRVRRVLQFHAVGLGHRVVEGRGLGHVVLVLPLRQPHPVIADAGVATHEGH